MAPPRDVGVHPVVLGAFGGAQIQKLMLDGPVSFYVREEFVERYAYGSPRRRWLRRSISPGDSERGSVSPLFERLLPASVLLKQGGELAHESSGNRRRTSPQQNTDRALHARRERGGR